jgi:hypothetical protein
MDHVKGKKLRVRIRRASFFSYVAFLLFAFYFSLSPPAAAQDDPPDTAPPPLKILSKEERKKLADEDDIKARTTLALQMMSIRLESAEKHSAAKDFDTMFRELGSFHALVDDSLTFLEKRDTSNKKVLDTLKKLEIGLRGFIPRLEVVRREIPLRYEDYVHQLMKFVREARTRAIDPMFSDNVVRTKPNNK